jgi:hypothetical protein
MVPDIALFFPFVSYRDTHSPLGLVTTCLPLGLVLFAFFEVVMRRPLVALFPPWFQRRLPSKPQIPSKPQPSAYIPFCIGVCLAIVFGAFTHQVWDAFTHRDRWGTHLMPALNAHYSVGGYSVPGYKVFQYASSFVGLPLLATLAFVGVSRTKPNNEVTLLPLPWRVVVPVALCLIPIAIGAYALLTQPTLYHVLGTTVIQSGTTLMTALAIYSVAYQLLKKNHP